MGGFFRQSAFLFRVSGANPFISAAELAYVQSIMPGGSGGKVISTGLTLKKASVTISTHADNHILATLDTSVGSFIELTPSVLGSGYTFSAVAGTPVPYFTAGTVEGQLLVLKNTGEGSLAIVPAASSTLNLLGNSTLTLTTYDTAWFIWANGRWNQTVPLLTLVA